MNRRRYMITALGHSIPLPELKPVTVAYIDFTQESGAASGEDILNGGIYRAEMNAAGWILLPALSDRVPCPLVLPTRICRSSNTLYIPTPDTGPYQVTLTRIGNPAFAGLQQEVTATLYDPYGEICATATAQDTQVSFDGEYTLVIPGLEVQCPEVALEVDMNPVQDASRGEMLSIRACTLDYLQG